MIRSAAACSSPGRPAAAGAASSAMPCNLRRSRYIEPTSIASAAYPISIVSPKAVNMLMPPPVSLRREDRCIALLRRKFEGRARLDDRARRGHERRPQKVARGHGKGHRDGDRLARFRDRSEEHTSELQSLMRISYAVFCLKKNKTK